MIAAGQAGLLFYTGAKAMANDYQDDDDTSDALDVPSQLTRAQELPRDMMLLKMENEQMMAAALVKPRNNAKVVAQLIAVIDAYPAAADEAIYCRPVGTVILIQCGNARCKERYEVAPKDKDKATCPKCDSSEKEWWRAQKKMAEGLSIRAAETIRSIYGFNRIHTSVEELPDGSGKVRLSGIFVDYASGTMTSDERIVSPWYKGYGGTMTRHPEDRFLNVLVKAEKSKLRRDIILDAVPAVVKAAYKDACEKKIRDTVTEGYIDDVVLPVFRELGITMAQVELLAGKPKAMGWTQGDVATLGKLARGIRNGEFTLKELMDEIKDIEQQQEPKQEVPSGPLPDGADAQDLATPKGAKTKRPGGKEAKPKEEPKQEAKQAEKSREELQSQADADHDARHEREHQPEPKQEGKKPNVSTMFSGDDEEQGPVDAADMDPDLFEAVMKRVRNVKFKADGKKCREEIKAMNMSISQRAMLLGTLGQIEAAFV